MIQLNIDRPLAVTLMVPLLVFQANSMGNIHKLATSIAKTVQIAGPLAQNLRTIKNPLPEELILLKQSPLMWTINTQLAQTSDEKKIVAAFQPALPEYQEIGINAQVTAGIPPARHVPVYCFNDTSDNSLGQAGPGYMALRHHKGNKKLNFNDYHVACHEAQHILYNDGATNYIVNRPDYIRSFISLSTAQQQEFMFLSHGLKKYAIQQNLNALAETVADVQGAYQVDCCVCVACLADVRCSRHETSGWALALHHQGYICQEAMLTIAKDLRRHGRYCAQHALTHPERTTFEKFYAWVKR